jgi:hypothetical protein
MIDPTQLVNLEKIHYDTTYKQLCPSEGGAKKEEAIFKTMWELFVWATIKGILNKTKREIENRAPSPPFRWQNIKEKHQKLLIIYTLQAEGNFSILKEPDKLKKTIEEYSNAGIYIIHEEMAEDRIAYTSTETLIYDIQKRIYPSH